MSRRLWSERQALTTADSGEVDGKESTSREGEKKAEVQLSHHSSLPALWSVSRVHEKIRLVPDLFSGNGPAGRDPGCPKGELVIT